MNYQIVNWAQRHGVSNEALRELQLLFIEEDSTNISQSNGLSEGAVQNNIKLEAARNGWRLWRNNVGVLKDLRGVPVRYGLANDSKKLNEKVKSGDLIGIKPLVITPEMVGSIVGQFMSIEVKKSNWKYTGSPRERAQLKWQQIINGLGGYAKFANTHENL